MKLTPSNLKTLIPEVVWIEADARKQALHGPASISSREGITRFYGTLDRFAKALAKLNLEVEPHEMRTWLLEAQRGMAFTSPSDPHTVLSDAALAASAVLLAADSELTSQASAPRVLSTGAGAWRESTGRVVSAAVQSVRPGELEVSVMERHLTDAGWKALPEVVVPLRSDGDGGSSGEAQIGESRWEVSLEHGTRKLALTVTGPEPRSLVVVVR